MSGGEQEARVARRTQPTEHPRRARTLDGGCCTGDLEGYVMCQESGDAEQLCPVATVSQARSAIETQNLVQIAVLIWTRFESVLD
jgi:hypothetical protein